MSDNIHTLPGVKPPDTGKPRIELVKMLKRLVELAEEGTLQSFLGVGYASDGQRLTAWCDTHEDIYQMMGSIEWLKFEYVHRRTGAEKT
jgi:hypothetical protein